MGPLVRSLTQSAMLAKLGKRYAVPVHTTPVGFKFVGPAMIESEALAAGEESGGYAFRGNIPERDGIFSGLLFLELMVQTGKRPSELVQWLTRASGTPLLRPVGHYIAPGYTRTIGEQPPIQCPDAAWRDASYGHRRLRRNSIPVRGRLLGTCTELRHRATDPAICRSTQPRHRSKGSA